MWYWSNGTYSVVTGPHPFCIVNVKDCYTYLYIFMLKSLTLTLFLSNGTLYNCFMVMLCFTKMRLIVVMLTRFRSLNTCLSSSICCRSLWRRIALFALTWFTMASSCCWMNRRWPFCGQLLLVCFFFHSAILWKLYILVYTVVYCIYHTRYWNISTRYHDMFHKTTTSEFHWTLYIVLCTYDNKHLNPWIY